MPTALRGHGAPRTRDVPSIIGGLACPRKAVGMAPKPGHQDSPPMHTRIFLPLLAAVVGCNSAPPAPEFVEARGKVTAGGKPVAKGYVGFIPTGSQQEVYARVENGEFTARVMPGKYQ